MATRKSGSDRSRNDELARLAGEMARADREDVVDDDFRFALRELVDAYKPVLEEDLARASAPEALIKEALANPASCEEEFAYADRLFTRFTSEEVAVRLLPAAAREMMGPAERWRWCLLHLRCCLVFGWLLCRSPRTFRASVYYLYRYWRCVREVLGAPVANPPTPNEREDFATLVKALAVAYKPYLDDQLAAVEFTAGLPDEIFSGRLDCEEGSDAATEVLERLLTTDTAPALLGKELLARHRQDPLFWFCRCWCLCAIRLGCCLARARTLRDVFRCLRTYRRCLAECFRPLHCALTAPAGCVKGTDTILPGRILEPVVGDAEGYSFGRYLIEVRDPSGDLLSGVVVYPVGGVPTPSATQGNAVVSGGTLGWIDTKKCAEDAGVDLLSSTTFTVTLRVFAADGSELSPPCTTTFNLSVNETYIKQVSAATANAYVDPNEPLRNGGPGATLATVGGNMHVRGAANVFGCVGEKIREYTLWAIPDPTLTFAQPAPYTAVMPGPSWVMLAHVEYGPQTIAQPLGGSIAYTADQVRQYNVLDGDPLPQILNNVWSTRDDCVTIPVDATTITLCWRLPSLAPNVFNSNASLLPWRLAPLVHEGGTGKFTFLLRVVDTSGNTYYDVQRAWIDNEPIKAQITGIGGLAPCADLYMQTTPGVFKTVNVEGTAWDQLIEPGNLAQPTSDNFDRYTIHVAKQGVAGSVLMIDSATPVPPRPNPPGIGTLLAWNLQTLDKPTNPLLLPPPLRDHLLERGEECTFNVILQVWDKTIVNEGTVHYSGLVLFPLKIINGPEPA